MSGILSPYARSKQQWSDGTSATWLSHAVSWQLPMWTVRDHDFMLEGQTRGEANVWLHAECAGGLLYSHRGPVSKPAMIPCQTLNREKHHVQLHFFLQNGVLDPSWDYGKLCQGNTPQIRTKKGETLKGSKKYRTKTQPMEPVIFCAEGQQGDFLKWKCTSVRKQTNKQLIIWLFFFQLC